MRVGDIVKIQFGNINEYGYVYWEYFDTDGSAAGISVLTESGRDLGGFSNDEQDQYLTFVKQSHFIYNFKSVMILDQDINKGIFRSVFASIDRNRDVRTN